MLSDIIKGIIVGIILLFAFTKQSPAQFGFMQQQLEWQAQELQNNIAWRL